MSLLDKIQRTFNNNIILIFIIIVGFLGTIVLVYFRIIKPKLNPSYVPNKEYIKKTQPDHPDPDNPSKTPPLAHVILFTANWCPYCKKIKDEKIFDTFKEENNGKIVKGYQISVEEIDCSNDDSPEMKTKLDEFNVDGFPSIKLLKEGDQPNNAYDFDAKPTLKTLNQFVQAVL